MSTDPFEKFRDMAEGNPPEPVPDPRKSYDRPIDVLDDANLDESAKRETLTLWAAEIDDQLKAEEEGMSASDPIHNRAEAALADEAAKVGVAMLKLDEESGPDSQDKA